MSQFDLIDVPSSNESVIVGSEKGGKIVGKGSEIASSKRRLK